MLVKEDKDRWHQSALVMIGSIMLVPFGAVVCLASMFIWIDGVHLTEGILCCDHHLLSPQETHLMWMLSQAFVDSHKELVADIYKIFAWLGGTMFIGGYINVIYQVRRKY